uniref:Putative cellulose synthase-like D1 n=1 Tax=Coleochaete orbicularis TaxID=3124 RepID=A0A097DBL9_COLOB|nr:putative cellulose synthase-like D1 [Coleochaete orbicularis]
MAGGGNYSNAPSYAPRSRRSESLGAGLGLGVSLGASLDSSPFNASMSGGLSGPLTEAGAANPNGSNYPDNSGPLKETPRGSRAERFRDLRHSYGGETLDQINPLYRVSLPPTPDHQMYGVAGSDSPAPSLSGQQPSRRRQEETESNPFSTSSQAPPWREQSSIVASTIFTGGFKNDPRGHIMMTNDHQSFNKRPQLDPQVGPRSARCSQAGCDGLVMRDGNGNESFPCDCHYRICRDCYKDALKDGGECPGCKDIYREARRMGLVPHKKHHMHTENDDDDDDDEEDVRRRAERKALSVGMRYSREKKTTHGDDSDSSDEGGRAPRKRSGAGMPPAGNLGSLAIIRKEENDMQVQLYGDSKATYGYGSAVWPKGQEKPHSGIEGDDTGAPYQPLFEDSSNRPLCRKVAVSLALISPYRIMMVIRLLVLVVFLWWRFTNPTRDAMWLWMASIICETWFGFSWILDQFPKMNPVTRFTDLDVLQEKFEGTPAVPLDGKAPSSATEPPKSYLPGIDIFVSTADPDKEPVLTTANTVLSILAANYPVEKIGCYISDDGGALLTFEALAETASFAAVWIPFCRKHDIEPRCPEYYFQQRGDPTKGKLRPDFVRDRRRVKREYDEFKVRINGLPDAIRRRSEELNTREELRAHKTQMTLDPTVDSKCAKATWMADGSKWPGTWSWPSKDHSKNDHAGIIQVMLAPPSSDPTVSNDVTDIIDVTDVDTRLPLLVYVSREKRPGYDHNKKAGAMNALIRTSAIMSNGPFILNLDCDHYIYNADAMREAMCFMMARMGEKVCYVQFPQRFEGIDLNDRYANNNTVFFDINMRGLDGIQGPFYAGTGCVFRRTALYGMDPPSKFGDEEKKSRGCCLGLCCCCGGRRKKNIVTQARQRRVHAVAAARAKNEGETEPAEDAQEGETGKIIEDDGLLPKQFGPSEAFLGSILEAEEAGKPLGQGRRGLIDENGRLEARTPDKVISIQRQPLDAETVADAILVISSWYEDNTEWGRRIGWIYGSVTEDVVTGYRMHNRGWKSVYAHPVRPAFKGTAPINLTDRLHQVLRWATGSVEIFFSRNNAMFGSGKLKCLQRVAYLNVGIYPFTSIFLTVYCFLPAICLLTDKFITPEPIQLTALAYILALSLATYAIALMEVRWSGVTLEEWWRNEQFWVIGGTSAHLAAVYQGLLKVIAGVDISFTLTSKSADEDDPYADLHLVKWSSLMIPPLTIIMVNLIACVMGFARTVYSPYPRWSDLLGKLFFSIWVLIHLYPFAKGLMGKRNKTPTIIFVWAGLLSIILSLIWTNISPPEGTTARLDNTFKFP